jgi:hypothetical protein
MGGSIIIYIQSPIFTLDKHEYNTHITLTSTVIAEVTNNY